jgi:transposase
MVGSLTGIYHLSRRQVPLFLKDVFGIVMSLGSVSNVEGRTSEALTAASDEALAHVEAAPLKHMDETSWIRDAQRCSLWVLANTLVTVFRITRDGRRNSLRSFLKRRRGVLVSDRATVFKFWLMRMRQICLAHLLRLFIGFSQRAGPAAALGEELVDYVTLVFLYWRQFRQKLLPRDRFQKLIGAIRVGMRQCLQRAVRAQIAEVSGSCKNLLAHWAAMWTFTRVAGVEPTNNHAERELRNLVIWRKRCFGTQSERGDRFVERILTVAHTLRKQKSRVLDFLHQSIVAAFTNIAPPRLIPAK